TFDFALSDPSTQTQTFRVLLTGATTGVLPSANQISGTQWWVPLDPRSGATNPTLSNGYPGSGIAYYLPCIKPSLTFPVGNITPANPDGYFNNQYPAPGTPYGPITCPFPDPSHLYEKLPMLMSGWPGLTTAQNVAGNLVTPGWLLVSQDV